MTTKIKLKLTWANIKNTLFGKMDGCGLFPIISRVTAYGFILYFLIFSMQDRIKILVYFSALTALLELMWCKFDFCKRLIWHLISFITLICFLLLILAQTSVYWNKAYAVENSINNLVRDAPTAIIVVDKEGFIKNINSNAENLIGWSKEEIVGRPVSVLIPAKKLKYHDKAFASIVKKIEEDNISEALWISNNSFNHGFHIVTKFGQSRAVKLYVLAVSFPNYRRNEYSMDFYAIIETE